MKIVAWSTWPTRGASPEPHGHVALGQPAELSPPSRALGAGRAAAMDRVPVPGLRRQPPTFTE